MSFQEDKSLNHPVHPQHGLDQVQLYKPGRGIEEVQRQYGLTDVIKLASNENPIGASPKAIKAILDSISDIFYYPDGESRALTKALARKLDIFPEQIVMGNGADGLIMMICQAYLDEDSDVIVSCSSFPVYDIYTHIMRARLVKTPLKNYGLDLQAMLAAINERTKVIFVCNPNNPTGTIVTAAEVDHFLAAVPEHVLVVFDEAYYHFVDSNDYPDTLPYVRNGRPNVIVLRTFSKAYGLAGLRLGYGIAQEGVLAPMKTVKEPFAVNLLAQKAGLAALDDDDFLNRTLLINSIGREYLYQEFARLKLLFVHSHTNFVFVDLGPRTPEIIERLTAKGIIIRPGGGYDLPTWARVSVGDPIQNERLIAELEDILEALK